MYISSKHIRQQYDISNPALRRWAERGRIACKRLPGGKRLYLRDDVLKLLGDAGGVGQKEKIIYARVSSSHQKEDLDRQITDLQHSYPFHRVLSDIGSGLNFRRRGLQTLLELVFQRAVEEVVVAFRDRLCRFAFDLLESIFQGHGVRLVVHGGQETSGGEQELAEDLLFVVNFFVARNNGRRAAENRRKRQRQQEKGLGGQEDQA
jgi:predicted site-specific integrase-resolvase